MDQTIPSVKLPSLLSESNLIANPFAPPKRCHPTFSLNAARQTHVVAGEGQTEQQPNA